MSCLYLDSCTSVMPLRWEIMQNNHSQSTWDIRMTSVWYLQGVAAGVLRGVGKQLIGALCNFVAFYFIGFPIGVSLMFAANMGIVGKTKLCVCVCVTLSQRICLAAFRNFFFFFFDRWQDFGQDLSFASYFRWYFTSLFCANLIGKRLQKMWVATSVALSLKLSYLKLKCTISVFDVCDQALVRAGVHITKENATAELEHSGKN